MAAKVAIITGASRGLGEVVARFLAGQGYALVLTARHAEPLQKVALALSSFNVPVQTVVGDVTDAAHRTAAIDAANALGGLSVLVNNASDLGVSPLLPLADFPLDALERVFKINVVAPIALTQAALPALKANGGLVINLSSDAAKGGYPTWGGYGLTKAALDLASLTLANELSDAGVSVVSVDPGDMRTVMHQDAFPGDDISDRPLPDVTVPFWAWLFGQDRAAVSGGRYAAQAQNWEAVNEAV
ncbi:MAG: SDR family oxidoreductase [Chloroflexi bacterium]|nr:SDR family oxidoreductase [Chloroflexota bacterium]